MRRAPPNFSLHFRENSGHLPSTSDVIRVHSPNTDLIQSPYDRLVSSYLSQSFSLGRPTGAGTARSQWWRRIGKGGKNLPPLYCASASAFQLLSCLRVETMGIWDTILCDAIFKEILHNSSFFFFSVFGEPSSKCHWQTQKPVKLECKNLDGLASQLLAGQTDIGMIMRHAFQKNEWINNQSSVWEE